eukprot:s1382_g10.t1
MLATGQCIKVKNSVFTTTVPPSKLSQAGYVWTCNDVLNPVVAGNASWAMKWHEITETAEITGKCEVLDQKNESPSPLQGTDLVQPDEPSTSTLPGAATSFAMIASNSEVNNKNRGR